MLYIGWPSGDGGGIPCSLCTQVPGELRRERNACLAQDPRETGRDLWTVGPTCIPQETAMSRRVSPCGLGGIIRGHQVACWPLLSGRMAPLRWFLCLPVMDLWSWSLLLLQLVFCAGGPGPRLPLCVRIRLCIIRLSPLLCLRAGARWVCSPYPFGVGGARLVTSGLPCLPHA